VRISRATPDLAARLTEIAHTAKRHWGYPEHWIERWRDALTITPEYVVANPCFVAMSGTDAIGFSALRTAVDAVWIDHVWVLPDVMGQGLGRRLFEVCEVEARRSGATRLKIEADPNAELFYQRMGAFTVGRAPAPMDGIERFLPLMEKLLG
jgi:GNAT superfamily N-acetyltransferase